MPGYQRDVRRVINEYIQPDSTLATMEGIHRELTGEAKDFTRWEDVEMSYMQRDWDDESYRRFLELSREFVEGDTETTSESYFDIVEPEEDLSDTVISELSAREATESDDLGVEEGFVHRERDDGIIEGTYYYSNVSIEITAEPDIRRQPTPKSINFRIDPDERLLIIETTYPAHVQKIQSVFNNETAIGVAICGDLTVFPSQADESVTSFINEFRDEEDQITHE
jgi:hypothetical protein